MHVARDCSTQQTMIMTTFGDYESQEKDKKECGPDDAYNEVEYPDSGELLMIRRFLNSSIRTDEIALQENIFYSKCTIQCMVCYLIIDDVSCINVANQYMVDKLGLEN